MTNGIHFIIFAGCPRVFGPMQKRLRKDLLVAALILIVVVLGMTVIGLLT